MKDKILDQFLYETKRDAERAKARLPVQPSPPEVSIYANPNNWYCTRIVELVCRTLEGTDESLGFFQEERHRISLSARRLRPCTCETGGIPGEFIPGAAGLLEVGVQEVSRRVQEIVQGDYWLRPRETPKLLDPPGEVEALKALFEELIGEA